VNSGFIRVIRLIKIIYNIMKNNKKITVRKIEDFNIRDIDMDDIVYMLSTFELEIMLYMEPFSYDTDIMLLNMLDYFIEVEEYEYACICRDEIASRKFVIY
jgi:hypothetical protein